MVKALLHGFLIQMSLIVAIGPQNAFVLTQGIRRNHVAPICLICTLSDALLIALGVGGMGAALQAAPQLETALRWGGAAFLLWYAWGRVRAGLGPAETLGLSDGEQTGLRAALMACLAFTWLNPHVYLDTVVLIGSLSGQFPDHRLMFGAGAAGASALFFFALGYGARYLAPVLARPTAWRALELSVAVMMITIAAGLMKL